MLARHFSSKMIAGIDLHSRLIGICLHQYAGNWRIPLCVLKEQEQYVANTTTILARAYAYRNARSQALLIYEDDTPVGMVLYHDEDSLDAYIFSEILIDERFQRKGYGTRAKAKNGRIRLHGQHLPFADGGGGVSLGN